MNDRDVKDISADQLLECLRDWQRSLEITADVCARYLPQRVSKKWVDVTEKFKAAADAHEALMKECRAESDRVDLSEKPLIPQDEPAVVEEGPVVIEATEKEPPPFDGAPAKAETAEPKPAPKSAPKAGVPAPQPATANGADTCADDCNKVLQALRRLGDRISAESFEIALKPLNLSSGVAIHLLPAALASLAAEKKITATPPKPGTYQWLIGLNP